MLSRRFLIVALVLLAGVGAAVLAVALVGGERGGSPGGSGADSTEPVSGPPIHLSGPDVTTGRTIGLSELADKAVVLTVWASWCRACPKQAAPLRQFLDRHAEARFLAVDTQENAGAARAFLAAHDLTLPTIADQDGHLAAKLGVRELPTTLFLAKDHRVAALWEGPAQVGRLRAGLAAAKGE